MTVKSVDYSRILGDLSHALAEGCERVLRGTPFLCAFTAPRIIHFNNKFNFNVNFDFDYGLDFEIIMKIN